MKTLAVHLHLYYTNQLPEILKFLCSLDGIDYDLFVTMVQENETVAQRIKAEIPDATIWVVPNRGYDVGPFIYFLHHIDPDHYKYILKLHTKSQTKRNVTLLNRYGMDNKLWNYILWDALLGSPKQINNCLETLNQDDKVGMVGAAYCLSTEKRDYQSLLPFINKELTGMNFYAIQEMSFIAGTMFLVRSFLMKPLLKYQIEDFEPTNKIKDGTLAHALERMMAIITFQQGYLIEKQENTRPFWIKLILWKNRLVRFLYQNKKTKSEHRIIKICKFPISHTVVKG